KDVKGAGKPDTDALSDNAKKLITEAHKTIDGMTGDFKDFHMNKAVARMRGLFNEINSFNAESDSDKAALHEAIEIFLKMIAPMIPHLAETLWAEMGHDTLICEEDWPVANDAFLAADTVTIGVQVNGKVRATITLPANADSKTFEETALAQDGVQKAIDGKQVRKVIVVPGRIVNVVVG
ncbi:MAG: class I tRNA ligase family protein, partial [Pseudomonadota bacterium]|nr:class I tRNA ligase family protein [Pseudomonadota bacterium]